MKKQLIGVQILTLRRHHNETAQEEHQYPDQEVQWETISRNISIEGRIRGSLQERVQRDFFFSPSVFRRTHPKNIKMLNCDITSAVDCKILMRHEGTKNPDNLNKFFQNLGISQHAAI